MTRLSRKRTKKTTYSMDIDVGEVRMRLVNSFFDEIERCGHSEKSDKIKDSINKLDEDMEYFFNLKYNNKTLRYER